MGREQLLTQNVIDAAAANETVTRAPNDDPEFMRRGLHLVVPDSDQ
jgi:hypothetical protein